MSFVAASAFLPAGALALVAALVSLRLGRARGRGLALLGLMQAVWIAGLCLLSSEATRDLAERILPLGMLEAAAFTHAGVDLAGRPRPRLVGGAWLAAGIVALVGAVRPDLYYGPGAAGIGAAFVPVAIAATLGTAAMLLWLLGLARATRGRERLRFLLLAGGALTGALGGGGSLALIVLGQAPPLVAAPLMAASILLAALATLDREEGRARALVRAGLVYALLTAALSAIGLPLFAWMLVGALGAPTSAGVVAYAAWIAFSFALPLDPLRALVVDGLGRRLVRAPIGVRDLVDAVEQQEVRADHAERLAAIGALTSAVAHELRNPLGVLLVQAKLLEREGAEPARVAAVREQVERARGFIDALLRYGKPRPLVLARAALVPLARRAAERAHAPHPGASVVRVVGNDGPDTVADVDADAIGDVLVVLVDNALAALEESGQAGEVILSVEPGAGERVVIAVDDDGPGVPEAIADRVFQPFVTGRGRDAPRPGTGLGLAIAARWVERHGGTVRHARSARGGARFVVELPRDASAVARAEAA